MAKTAAVGKRERRVEAARLGIIDAAEELLAERGAHGVTLDAVAERADVVVQTIYNRVGGRAALLLAVTQRAIAENRAYVDAAYALPVPPVERIRAAMAAYVRFATDKPHQFRTVTNPPDDPEVLAQVDDLIASHMTNLATALREAIATGTISPDFEPDVAAPALWAMASGVLSLDMRATGHPFSGDHRARMLDFFETLVERGMTTPEPR
ncbi:TetR/AcrR family transcriptional regulator [Iamia sp. SCSIO 61187]|uniref:TetR/AcrR family transcriptional regulator n=1 Tax=Iamia sp. SCSIO 61187 TaxID=2722752 RepID=UPI001C62B7CE|nr:TetR/AcrR family transcriptional regulator [Iamia sp. SCSIO 61187]QYG91749.1 TetR/AcrR family transcriptional regulator [Iamia sp. SCSIO 61187]